MSDKNSPIVDNLISPSTEEITNYLPGPCYLKYTTPFTGIQFGNEFAGNVFGKIFVNDSNKLEFTGNMEDSAKEFLTYVCNNFNTSLEQKNQYIHQLEQVLHQLQLYGAVVMNKEKLEKLLHAIYDWSYAHRCSESGEYTETERQALIDKAFNKIKTL
jgi:hypothetical protein